MADVFTKAKRSIVMSRIKGRGNRGTEIAMIQIFQKNAITGWRRNYPAFGRPDFVFQSAKIAVFIDGCFWHQCCIHSNIPKNNRDFWLQKFQSNKARDRLVNRTLRAAGWKVIRIWEHELIRKNEKRLLERLQKFGIRS